MLEEPVARLLWLVWLVLPAYIANAAPVVLARFYRKPRRPLDRGLVFVDGRRVLGDHKTVEGTCAAIAAGLAVSIAQAIVENSIDALLRGGVLTIGAVLGDLAGAFVKRRLGLRPGAPAPLLDQLAFLYVALTLVVLTGLCSLGWDDFALLTILTLVLHILSNAAAYMLHLKSVPW